ncbi:MAG: transposase [Desulfobulbus sp.]|nr:transposase [Desulfobulbus sp.]
MQRQKKFSSLSPDSRVPQNHPLRRIRTIADPALKKLSPVIRELYSKTGRPSIPPEQLLRSLLLQILYTIRSERMLVAQLYCNLRLRWFAGFSMDEPIWHHPVYSKNRDRLLHSGIAVLFPRSIRAQAGERRCCPMIIPLWAAP